MSSRNNDEIKKSINLKILLVPSTTNPLHANIDVPQYIDQYVHLLKEVADCTMNCIFQRSL